MNNCKRDVFVPSTRLWNSPVFVIQKRGDKWHLLQDPRETNAAMEDMGALQPGLPSPTMIPWNWHLTIIDLKDCFSTTPLSPEDPPKFAFSVHWAVLPLKPAYVNFWRKTYHIDNMDMYLINMKIAQLKLYFFVCANVHNKSTFCFSWFFCLFVF